MDGARTASSDSNQSGCPPRSTLTREVLPYWSESIRSMRQTGSGFLIRFKWCLVCIEVESFRLEIHSMDHRYTQIMRPAVSVSSGHSSVAPSFKAGLNKRETDQVASRQLRVHENSDIYLSRASVTPRLQENLLIWWWKFHQEGIYRRFLWWLFSRLDETWPLMINTTRPLKTGLSISRRDATIEPLSNPTFTRKNVIYSVLF